ncbi:MAG: hypothetical protein IBJ09_15670 [Bacteroidia bacterium]|nr:hypothetical protein [Bacteroidia bacterium]
MMMHCPVLRRIFQFFGLCLCSLSICHASVLPDSIVIHDGFGYMRSYNYTYVLKSRGKQYTLYKVYERHAGLDTVTVSEERRRMGSVTAEQVKRLVAAVEDTGFAKLEPRHFGFDKAWQEANASMLLGYARERRTYWTPAQEAYMLAALKDPARLRDALNEVVGREGIYVISRPRYDFRVVLYYRNRVPFSIEADANPLGMPWILHGRLSYNPALPRLFADLLPESDQSANRKRFRAESGLPEKLSESVCDHLKPQLDSLAAAAIMAELLPLNAVFDMSGAREYGYFGRYISSKEQLYKVSLRNEYMHPQISLQYMVSRSGKGLYPRDSLLREWKNVVGRVQGIPFLQEFLDGNSARRLDLYYFNNSGMNPYLKNGFNKNPEEWARYDKDPDPRFLELYCGCNFRLPDAWLDEALFFELFDEENNASIWIVLPDNTPVLYHFSGPQVYRYSSADMGTNGGGVQYACKKFNPDGSMKK